MLFICLCDELGIDVRFSIHLMSGYGSEFSQYISLDFTFVLFHSFKLQL